jgi:hypothetical protein
METCNVLQSMCNQVLDVIGNGERAPGKSISASAPFELSLGGLDIAMEEGTMHLSRVTGSGDEFPIGIIQVKDVEQSLLVTPIGIIQVKDVGQSLLVGTKQHTDKSTSRFRIVSPTAPPSLAPSKSPTVGPSASPSRTPRCNTLPTIWSRRRVHGIGESQYTYPMCIENLNYTCGSTGHFDYVRRVVALIPGKPLKQLYNNKRIKNGKKKISWAESELAMFCSNKTKKKKKSPTPSYIMPKSK